MSDVRHSKLIEIIFQGQELNSTEELNDNTKKNRKKR